MSCAISMAAPPFPMPLFGTILAGALQLVQRIRGHHAKGHGHAGLHAPPRDAVRDGGRAEVEVRRNAANQAAGQDGIEAAGGRRDLHSKRTNLVAPRRILTSSPMASRAAAARHGQGLASAPSPQPRVTSAG